MDDYGASSEVTIKLGEQSIRRDAVMPDGKLIIIKQILLLDINQPRKENNY